jgi:hypothetical protein
MMNVTYFCLAIRLYLDNIGGFALYSSLSVLSVLLTPSTPFERATCWTRRHQSPSRTERDHYQWLESPPGIVDALSHSRCPAKEALISEQPQIPQTIATRPASALGDCWGFRCFRMPRKSHLGPPTKYYDEVERRVTRNRTGFYLLRYPDNPDDVQTPIHELHILPDQIIEIVGECFRGSVPLFDNLVTTE